MAESIGSQTQLCESAVVRFGGWHNGDNHKPGRAWYFICSCGKVGLGQLLEASAWRQWGKHRRG